MGSKKSFPFLSLVSVLLVKIPRESGAGRSGESFFRGEAGRERKIKIRGGAGRSGENFFRGGARRGVKNPPRFGLCPGKAFRPSGRKNLDEILALVQPGPSEGRTYTTMSLGGRPVPILSMVTCGVRLRMLSRIDYANLPIPQRRLNGETLTSSRVIAFAPYAINN